MPDSWKATKEVDIIEIIFRRRLAGGGQVVYCDVRGDTEDIKSIECDAADIQAIRAFLIKHGVLS